MIRRPLVGRSVELATLDGVLGSDGSSAVVRVSGPTGIGKSALLLRALQRCVERRIPFRHLDPTLAHVDADAINRALGELAAEGGPRRVLIVDDIHLARDAERWLVGKLHLLAESTTVFIADRHAVSLAWLGGWAPIEIALGPLSDPGVTELLDAYAVSPATRTTATQLSDGNPLLLTLFADGERKGARAVEEALLRLAATFFPCFDEPPRVTALSMLAIAPATHELLEAAIGDERQTREVLGWLRSLSVIDHTREGMALHAAARRACSSLVRTHYRAVYQAALDAVREAKGPPLAVAESRPSRVDSVPPSSILAWRGGNAAIAVAPESPAPQFSEMLRERLDDLARQASLTDREREVFELLVLGRSANEMATVLGITTRTVKFHQQRVLEKIGADSRLDILRLLL